MGFEPTIPESERAKTVHVIDRAATVTGNQNNYPFVRVNKRQLDLISFTHENRSKKKMIAT
jgi:hypothetical protein